MRGMIEFYDVGVAGAVVDSFTREFTTYKALSTIPENFLRMRFTGNGCPKELAHRAVGPVDAQTSSESFLR